MKVTKRTVDEKNVILNVTVPRDEVGARVNEAYKMLVRAYQISPKKDSTPQIEIEALLGKEEARKAVEKAVMDSVLPFAVTQAEVMPGCTPQTYTEDTIDPEEDFVFNVRVFKKPSFSLSSYDPVAITIPPLKTSQEEVEARKAEVAKGYTTLSEDKSHSDVRNGDIVVLSTKTTQDGEEIEALNWTGRTYQLGEGYMPQEFDEALVGMVAGGESKTFDFEAPGGKPDENGAVGLAKFTTTATVSEIRKENIPTITTAWVEVHIDGCNTLAEYEEKLKEEIYQEHSREYEQFKNAQCVAELAKRFEGRIDDELYEAAMAEQNQMLDAQLRQQGMRREDWLKAQGLDEQQLMMSVMMQARQRLTQSFALDSLAAHLGLKVEPSDIDALFFEMAGGQEYQVPMMRAEYERSGRMYIVYEAALRMKANKWLVDNSEITYLTDEQMDELNTRS